MEEWAAAGGRGEGAEREGRAPPPPRGARAALLPLRRGAGGHMARVENENPSFIRIILVELEDEFEADNSLGELPPPEADRALGHTPHATRGEHTHVSALFRFRSMWGTISL